MTAMLITVSPTVIGGCYAGVSTLVASYAIYKWYQSRSKLAEHNRKYENDAEVMKTLANQYCQLDTFPILRNIIPEQCDAFYDKILELCIEVCDKNGVWKKRALDIGSGTGGLAFRLKRFFSEVVAVDSSIAMTIMCKQLQEYREMYGFFPAEGSAVPRPFSAKLSGTCENDIVIWNEDGSNMSYTNGKFDCITLVNTLCELEDPPSFCSSISNYMHPKGILVIVDYYNWPQDSTIIDIDGSTSYDKIKTLLGAGWNLVGRNDIPFFSAQTDRSAMVGVAEATMWQWNADHPTLVV